MADRQTWLVLAGSLEEFKEWATTSAPLELGSLNEAFTEITYYDGTRAIFGTTFDAMRGHIFDAVILYGRFWINQLYSAHMTQIVWSMRKRLA